MTPGRAHPSQRPSRGEQIAAAKVAWPAWRELGRAAFVACIDPARAPEALAWALSAVDGRRLGFPAGADWGAARTLEAGALAEALKTAARAFVRAEAERRSVFAPALKGLAETVGALLDECEPPGARPAAWIDGNDGEGEG